MQKNDKKIGELVEMFVQSGRIKPKLFEKKIENAWMELMGRSINRYTRSITLREQILRVKIDSAPLRQELHYARDKIKEKLNEFLREEYIQEVKIY
jgi:predicted nucleic acid-binding Zn ribbon protein